MEKVVRTQPEGLDPAKGLSQYLEDGWKVKMCNSIWRSNGTECLEYIITKETEEENPPELVKIVIGSKDRLRSGMVVQCLDCMRWLVMEINGKMYGLCGEGYISFEDYNEDLTNKIEEAGNVTYIWRMKEPIPLRNIKDLKEEDADWARIASYAR